MIVRKDFVPHLEVCHLHIDRQDFVFTSLSFLVGAYHVNQKYYVCSISSPTLSCLNKIIKECSNSFQTFILKPTLPIPPFTVLGKALLYVPARLLPLRAELATHGSLIHILAWRSRQASKKVWKIFMTFAIKEGVGGRVIRIFPKEIV